MTIKTYTIDTDKWRVVPVDPTDEIVDVIWDIGANDHAATNAWKKLLSAAPEPEQQSVEPEETSYPVQEWKGMDGAITYHLIDRHADNWKDVGEMMQQWLVANQQTDDIRRQMDELVKALEWALSNINVEPFEWSCEEDCDAHKEACDLLAIVKEKA